MPFSALAQRPTIPIRNEQKLALLSLFPERRLPLLGLDFESDGYGFSVEDIDREVLLQAASVVLEKEAWEAGRRDVGSIRNVSDSLGDRGRHVLDGRCVFVNRQGDPES